MPRPPDKRTGPDTTPTPPQQMPPPSSTKAILPDQTDGWWWGRWRLWTWDVAEQRRRVA
jgi:hypothetical protein